jgi:DNA-binding MarR family transcriptional regulator
MSPSRRPVSVDSYVVDILLRDLVGHDQHPAAFLVYLNLYFAAARNRWQPVALSLRELAESTGFSKSAVQVAMKRLRSRELVRSAADSPTATPRHAVLRHWKSRPAT